MGRKPPKLTVASPYTVVVQRRKLPPPPPDRILLDFLMFVSNVLRGVAIASCWPRCSADSLRDILLIGRDHTTTPLFLSPPPCFVPPTPHQLGSDLLGGGMDSRLDHLGCFQVIAVHGDSLRF